MKEKVILAYSGGLDTTAIIPWLKENYDYEVICVCVDCGQGEELDGLEERAKFCGAEKLHIEDVVDEFCDEYIVPIRTMQVTAAVIILRTLFFISITIPFCNLQILLYSIIVYSLLLAFIFYYVNLIG